METVTTVGYGDFVPVTWWGRVIAALIMVVGISVLGVVSAGMAATLVKQSQAPAAPDRADEVLAELRRRDGLDAGRATAPLRIAPDATLLVSDGLERKETIARVVAAIRAAEARIAAATDAQAPDGVRR